MHKIERTFHPVGQGGFYSERHFVNGGLFNIVYDCGNRGCLPSVRPIVEEAFSENEEIDFLFISHFDFDHVSLIPDLRPYRSGRIKTVVLPLLYHNLRYVLAGYHLSTEDRRTKIDLIRERELILNPEEFFTGSNVIFVRPDEEYFQERVQDQDESLWGRLPNDGWSINQSRQDVFCRQGDWALIPFNYNWCGRYRPLMVELHGWLESINAKIEDLGRIDFVNKHRRMLKCIYRRLGYGLNENSMLLYSGPVGSCRVNVMHDGRFEQIKNIRPGCIYTGDADLKLFDLSRVYSQFMMQVGTVQIPHHGSKYSFCGKHFPAKNRICPVSYGIGNVYRHPDKDVLEQVEKSGGKVIPVTNWKASCFTEKIRCECM